MTWRSVKEELPARGEKVLATYMNRRGKRLIICAQHLERWEKVDVPGHLGDLGEYSEEKDAWFYPEGWYEVAENWIEFNLLVIWMRDVTHWMPLPKPPTTPA